MNKTSILLITVITVTIGSIYLLQQRVNSLYSSNSQTRPTDREKKVFTQAFAGAYEEEIDASGEVFEIDITAGVSEIEAIDENSMELWTYNGQVPGPELRLKLGDTLKINFTNNLPQETTVHFHGIRVPNAMDGVPGVTQDPIQPGESFVYEFVPKDAGTYWYHPHVRGSEQVERGLYGVIVVEDREPLLFDRDEVLVIDDWRLLENGEIDPRFNTMHDLSHDGRWGQTITVNGQTDYQLDFQPGERVRLRLVNSSNARIYQLSFGQLEATVIATDGMPVGETFDAKNFVLSPGNRVDLDITMPNDADYQEFTLYDRFTRSTNALAKLAVTGDPVETPDFVVSVAETFPDWSEASTLAPDKEYRLNARGHMMGIEWTINDKAYPDYDPITLKHNTFNKLRFTNESGRLHPMHLHGQFFQVIARNGKPVNEPYWRDTVLVGPRETVDIGLVPIDKGTWVNHCHILEHAEAGMLTVVEVK